MSNFIVIDLETTGIDVTQDDPLEIYAGCFNKSGQLLDEFHKYIKIAKVITPYISQLTGITQEVIEKKGEDPLYVARQWKQFPWKNKCRILAGHNVINFDYPLLCNWLIRTNTLDKFKLPTFHTIKDTMIMTCQVMKSNKWMKLQGMCQYLNIPFDQEQAHTAKYDVTKTAQCFLKMIKR